MIYFILMLAVTPGMREYIDQYGKIWNLLCEVQDREELPEVCRKNGTQRITPDYHNSGTKNGFALGWTILTVFHYIAIFPEFAKNFLSNPN